MSGRCEKCYRVLATDGEHDCGALRNVLSLFDAAARDGSYAEVHPHEAAGAVLELEGLRTRCLAAEKRADEAVARASEMHRRAQRLEGIERRMQRLRDSHARQIADIKAAAKRDARHMRDVTASLRLQLAEAGGTLPKGDDTATKLERYAAAGDEWGTLTSENSGIVNGRLIVATLRLAAATIRHEHARAEQAHAGEVRANARTRRWKTVALAHKENDRHAREMNRHYVHQLFEADTKVDAAVVELGNCRHEVDTLRTRLTAAMAVVEAARSVDAYYRDLRRFGVDQQPDINARVDNLRCAIEAFDAADRGAP